MDFDDDGSSAPIGKFAKFQPKAKLKPRAPPPKKVTKAAKPFITPEASDNQLVKSPTKAKVIENSASVSNEISVEETANLQTLSVADPLFSSMEHLTTINYEYMEEHGNIEENTNQPFLSGDSVIEKSEGFAGLDSVDDIIPQSATLADVNFDAFDPNNEEDTVNGSLSLPFHFLEMENIELETEGEQDFSSYDFTSEVDASSGKRASKFLPKVKQNHEKTTMGNESAEKLVNPSETQIPNEGFANDGSPQVRVECVFSTNPQIASLSEDMHCEPIPSLPEAKKTNGHNEEKAEPKKRRASSRSNKDKDVNGNDKPIRKRKKATESCENATDASKKSSEKTPKKFPRTTRRRNRSVNLSLLEIPEDEIDTLSLPVKDLIMLGEHRERQNKEVNTRQTVMPVEEPTPPVEEPVERTDDDFWGNPHDDYDEEYSAQAEGLGNPSTSRLVEDTAYFNYHSHMNRTPRIKWTKEDTQLFYEGLRQFGSDLSMIQHLFPGRTRQQIKLKYKKEEKQQPMQLLDALANRSKDLSHYKLVIGKLQEQIDREEEQRRAEEEASGATGNENEGNPEEGADEDIQEPKQDEGAKTEQNVDGFNAVKDDANESKIGSPTASNDNDLDMYDWSQYKSVF